MKMNGGLFLIQSRSNGEWTYTTPVADMFLETKDKAKESMKLMVEMNDMIPGDEIEYRYAEMKINDGQIVPVGYHSQTEFE